MFLWSHFLLTFYSNPFLHAMTNPFCWPWHMAKSVQYFIHDSAKPENSACLRYVSKLYTVQKENIDPPGFFFVWVDDKVKQMQSCNSLKDEYLLVEIKSEEKNETRSKISHLYKFHNFCTILMKLCENYYPLRWLLSPSIIRIRQKMGIFWYCITHQ